MVLYQKIGQTIPRSHVSGIAEEHQLLIWKEPTITWNRQMSNKHMIILA
jgi:hypothetical protein